MVANQANVDISSSQLANLDVTTLTGNTALINSVSATDLVGTNLEMDPGTVELPAITYTGSTSTGYYSSTIGQLDTSSAGVRVTNQRLSSGTPQLTLYNSAGSPNLQITATGTIGGTASTTLTNLISTGNLYIEAASTIRSATILATTQSGTAANLAIDGVGKLTKFTSSAKYKRDIEELDDCSIVDFINPKRYKSASKHDDPDQICYGLIAEDIAKLDKGLATYDINGEPDGVQYLMFIPFLIGYCQQLKQRIGVLESHFQ